MNDRLATGQTGRRNSSWLWAVTAGLSVMAIAGLLAALYLRSIGLGLRTLPRNLLSIARTAADQGKVKGYVRGDYTDVVFLHQSTGDLLVKEGGVREALTAKGFSFWDQSYNRVGLRDPQGNYTGYSYVVPFDNTDPVGLARIFGQRVYNTPVNTLSALLQHEVIVLKSCFPNSNLTSEEQFERNQEYYREMRETMIVHPDKLFILMTQPPLNPAETTPEAAARARRMADWLMSDEFLQGATNIVPFDFFNLLVAGDGLEANMLRLEYRNGSDSHPNQTANEEIAPVFVDFLIEAAQRFDSAQD